MRIRLFEFPVKYFHMHWNLAHQTLNEFIDSHDIYYIDTCSDKNNNLIYYWSEEE